MAERHFFSPAVTGARWTDIHHIIGPPPHGPPLLHPLTKLSLTADGHHHSSSHTPISRKITAISWRSRGFGKPVSHKAGPTLEPRPCDDGREGVCGRGRGGLERGEKGWGGGGFRGRPL